LIEDQERKGENSTANHKLTSFVFLTTIILFWAGSFIFIRLALKEIPPVALALARFSLATPILVGFSLFTRQTRQAMKAALRKDFLLFSGLGLTGVTLLYMFQFFSLRLIPATEGSIVINFHVIFAMLLSSAFLAEQLTRRKLVGVLLAFAGALVITVGSSSLTNLSFLEPLGVLLMAVAAFCWAAYSVLSKKALIRYSSTVSTCVTFLLGTLYLVPFALAEGGVETPFHSSWLAWCSVFYLAIPSSVITYVLWNRMIRKVDVTRVMVSLYVIPIPTAILSYLFLGETVTYSLILGGAVVMLGVYLTQTSRNTRNA
jgi:drug/metabolite transporter (DMT)-like permease